MDPNARQLDNEILGFIRRYATANEAPEEEFQTLALKIFFYQFKHNPVYRRFCLLENKTPASVFSWKEIPAIPVDAFKDYSLTSFPVQKTCMIFRTSGTSRGNALEKSRGEHAFDTLKLYEKSLLSSFKKSMLPDRDRMPIFFLLSSPKEVPDSSLSYMMGVVQRKWDPRGRDRFYVRNGKLSCEKLFNDLCAQKKPLMILSTAFSLKTFLDFLIQEKKLLRLKPGSRLMETGGFKGRAKEISKKALYRQCQKLLGLPLQACRSEYGMTELSSQYYAQGLSAQSASAWIRYRVMNPVTGQEAPLGSKGILRHYDLANRGSVMAIETQDFAIQRKNGFELVGRVPSAPARGCSLAYEN